MCIWHLFFPKADESITEIISRDYDVCKNSPNIFNDGECKKKKFNIVGLLNIWYQPTGWSPGEVLTNITTILTIILIYRYGSSETIFSGRFFLSRKKMLVKLSVKEIMSQRLSFMNVLFIRFSLALMISLHGSFSRLKIASWSVQNGINFYFSSHSLTSPEKKSCCLDFNNSCCVYRSKAFYLRIFCRRVNLTRCDMMQDNPQLSRAAFIFPSQPCVWCHSAFVPCYPLPSTGEWIYRQCDKKP